jgi:hypothetical protein
VANWLDGLDLVDLEMLLQATYADYAYALTIWAYCVESMSFASLPAPMEVLGHPNGYCYLELATWEADGYGGRSLKG